MSTVKNATIESLNIHSCHKKEIRNVIKIKIYTKPNGVLVF